MQARLWTALPGIVQRFDAAEMKVDVQPAINGRVRNPDGSSSSLQMPVLLDCPVLWQGGGGVTLTFPIQPGDECLIVIASRCIDAWWAQGGVQDPPEVRMHNLSDGFALVGVRSKPRAFTPNTTKARLTSDDGSTYIELDPSGQIVNVEAPGGINVNSAAGINMTAQGGINLNGVTIDSSGNVSSPATITAATDVVGNGKSLATHTHGGVQSGGSQTNPPT